MLKLEIIMQCMFVTMCMNAHLGVESLNVTLLRI